MPEHLQQRAQVVVRLRVVRIDAVRFLELRRRVIAFAGGGQCEADVVVGGRRVGVEAQLLLVLSNRFVEPARVEVEARDRVVPERVCRIALEQLGVRRKILGLAFGGNPR
jgi:hypothetical protein